MRLIDADAFRREIDNHWPFSKSEQSKHGLADMAKSTLLYVLNAMPTIEPERKKGKWIKLYAGNYKCSECGDWWGNDNNEMIEDFKFCPNCGADMRETT